MRQHLHQYKWLWFCTVLLALPLTLAIGARAIAAPNAQFTDPLHETIFDTRADLELLAEQVFGISRPVGWTGNVSVETPSVTADLWVDNENLANEVFGADIRPDGWIGATVASAEILVRNVRHDLEMTANEVLSGTNRPTEWRGSPVPYVVCNRTLQNLLFVMNRFYSVTPTTPQSALNYCRTIEAEVEEELISIVFSVSSAPTSQLLIATRADLDRLVDNILSTRPQGYIGEGDRASTAYTADILLDLETFANATVGAGVRPPGWAATIPNSPELAYLALRRNLELLADTTIGVGTRPPEWQGSNALDRCEPTMRNLTILTQFNYPQFLIDQIDVNAPDYCAQVFNAVNSFVENPPVLDVAEQEAEIQRFTTESNYAFTYLDVGATLYMGIMPPEIPFRAVYRNYGESTMMFVSGANFAVYVDRRYTDLPETTFRALPAFNGAEPVAFCDAYWCSGPGPTPTPTGSSPLLQVLFDTTPVAPPSQQELQTTKQLVSWNYIRVTYITDDAATQTAQVTLEICPAPAADNVTCEAVVSVFDNSVGTQKQPISQFNGLNVYDFRYGYTQNIVIEATTRYANDLWISDPTIR